jgi:hypothetical protein
MNYLRQEKSLRDHEPYLGEFAAIAARVSPTGANTFGGLPLLPGHGRPGTAGAARRRDGSAAGVRGCDQTPLLPRNTADSGEMSLCRYAIDYGKYRRPE